MRTILVLMDTLRRDSLKGYNGDSKVLTKNIDEFQKESTLFNQHWIGSAPCMPARRDIFTGREIFLERSWGPIEPFDVTLMDVLKENDIYTHISTDHCHYMRLGGEGYLQKFNTWDYLRGQEGDPWVSSIDDPLNMPETFYGKVRRQYQLNRQKWEGNPDDYPSPKTFKSGIDWIKENGESEDFFLMVEAFDPHEPFDVPQEFLDLYNNLDVEIDKDYYEIPKYGKTDVNEEAIKYLKKRYYALTTMSDKYFGDFINTLKEKGIYDDTLIILTTDHGFFFGEHDYLGKNVMPMYNELSHLPLIVHFPEGVLEGEEINQITQNIDIMPTILDFNNIEIPESVKGKSWKDILSGNYNREYALFGYHGMQMNIFDGKYTYLKAPVYENKPLYEYTSMPSGIRGYLGEGVEEQIETGFFIERSKYPVFKIPVDVPKQIQSESVHLDLIRDSYIFDIKKDYAQKNNLIDNKLLLSRMNKLLIKAMVENDSPEEQFERMGLKKDE